MPRKAIRNSKISKEEIGSMHSIAEQLKGPGHTKFIFGVLPPALELGRGCICRGMSVPKDKSSAWWCSHTQGGVRLTIVSILSRLGSLKMCPWCLKGKLVLRRQLCLLWTSRIAILSGGVHLVLWEVVVPAAQGNIRIRTTTRELQAHFGVQSKESVKSYRCFSWHVCISFLSVEEECDKLGIYRF